METLHYLLMKAYTNLNRWLMAQASTLGLSPGQPKILECLIQNGEVNQKAIASSCEIEPATVGSILSRMERDGLIARARHEGNRRQRNGDRRSLYVSLTPRGDALGRQMMELFHQADTRAAALLSPQEQAQLLSLLNKVCTAVQPEEEAVQ